MQHKPLIEVAMTKAYFINMILQNHVHFGIERVQRKTIINPKGTVSASLIIWLNQHGVPGVDNSVVQFQIKKKLKVDKFTEAGVLDQKPCGVIKPHLSRQYAVLKINPIHQDIFLSSHPTKNRCASLTPSDVAEKGK